MLSREDKTYYKKDFKKIRTSLKKTYFILTVSENFIIYQRLFV